MKQTLSFLLSYHLSRCFLGLGSLHFSEFWHVAENLWSCAWQSQSFLKKLFLLQKFWEMGRKYARNRVLNLKKNMIINFHWICSIMTVYILCCVPAQIVFWEKSCSWDIDPNPCSQADCRIFKSSVSPKQIDEAASFFACWYKCTKIKNWLKFFWLDMFQNGCCQYGLWTLKGTVSEEWTDWINWFFPCCYKFIQIKRCLRIFRVGLVKRGCSQSGGRTLKLTICKMNRWNNWFLHVDTNTQILKIDWMGMVQNECCQSGLWTLKLTASE